MFLRFAAFIKKNLQKLYDKIVSEKASPEYIARGWSIGMFWGCLIPFGFQLAFSIPTSFLLKGSKIGASVGTLITNHFTIFLIYPIQCYAGSRILGNPLSYSDIKSAMANVIHEESYEALLAAGTDLIAAFFVGGAIFSLIMTPATYFAVKNIVVRYRQKKECAEKIGASRQEMPK